MEKRNMRNRVFILPAVLLILAAPAALSQQISTRATGIGNAVTAVYDYVDTLRTNPAGLGFLKRSHGFLGIDGQYGLAPSAVTSDDSDAIGGGSNESAEIADFDFSARGSFVRKNWGVGIDQRLGYGPDSSYYSDLGVRAGLGFSLGPIGLGANVRYASRSVGPYPDPPATVIEDGSFDAVLEEVNSNETVSRLGVGIGSMLKFNKLTGGIYIPEVLQFSTADEVDAAAVLDTATVGVAYRPINVGSDDQRVSILRLLVSGDARNVGNETERSYHLGAEADLNFVIFGVSGRAGYIVSSMASEQPNYVSLGIGADLLFMTANVGVIFPEGTAEEDLQDSARYALTAAIIW
jgi:hypothetical protein